MHNTIKDVVATADQSKALGLSVGAHLISTIFEADGAAELASPNAELKARVISVTRTDSGGINIQTAVEVIEPTVEAPVVLTPEQEAEAYLKTKDFGPEAIKMQLERFGAVRILAMRDREKAKQDQDLDKELEAVLSGKATPIAETVN